MKIVGVCSTKGGVGKTTIAVQLACELAQRGTFAAIVDCDPQASAKLWAQPGRLPVEVHALNCADLESLAACRRSFASIAADALVVDCPSQQLNAVSRVMQLADLVLIPCGGSGMELVAAARTVALCRKVRAKRGEAGPLIRIVPTRVDRRTSSGRELGLVLEAFEEPVAQEICLSTLFVDAFNEGLWVGAMDSKSAAYSSIVHLCNDVAEALQTVSGKQEVSI